MLKDQLTTLQTALEGDDEVAVLDLTDPVTDALAEKRSRESALDALAQHVRASASPDHDARVAAEGYFDAVTRAEQERASAVQAVMGYLTDDTSAAAAATAVGDAVAAEEEVLASTDELADAKGGITLPAVLAVGGPDDLEIPKGTAVSATFEVENLGGESAPDVVVGVESDLALDVNPTALGALGPDAASAVELGGSPTTTGTFRVEVTARSGERAGSKSLSAIVASKADYLRRARQQIQTLRRNVAEMRDSGGSKGNGKDNDTNGLNGVLNKLETVEKRLTRLIRKVENGRGKGRSIDTQIRSVIETLQAVANQVDGMSPQQVAASKATLVTSDTEATTETLRTARDAQP